MAHWQEEHAISNVISNVVINGCNSDSDMEKFKPGVEGVVLCHLLLSNNTGVMVYKFPYMTTLRSTWGISAGCGAEGMTRWRGEGFKPCLEHDYVIWSNACYAAGTEVASLCCC